MGNKDGGPAFPRREFTHGNMRDDGQFEPIFTDVGGMTVRDWFAGQALAGTLADSETIQKMADAASDTGMDVTQYVAESSYEFADAMLSVRQKVAS